MQLLEAIAASPYNQASRRCAPRKGRVVAVVGPADRQVKGYVGDLWVSVPVEEISEYDDWVPIGEREEPGNE